MVAQDVANDELAVRFYGCVDHRLGTLDGLGDRLLEEYVCARLKSFCRILRVSVRVGVDGDRVRFCFCERCLVDVEFLIDVPKLSVQFLTATG